MMGQVNKERLAEYLGELQRKENTNDRYVAALRGETLTRKPYMILSGVSPSATYPVADPTAEENSQDRKVFTPNNTSANQTTFSLLDGHELLLLADNVI
ncbi:hypothetical protein TSUD_367540 [Trifolium subterraneum]|uniref:Uncharacterized protein n=1 Tax=Trifolium subterraneum TaxID=3900 RepID=A0A2Z6N9Z6_TRISU|nr:hypothetical protein TSUD_367540 [Trifolium subterraneum]